MSYVTDRAKRLGLTLEVGAKPLTLAVTNNDVVNSLKANSKQCALVRAAKRIPNVTRAYFFRTTAYLEYGDRMVRYTLPPSVQKEIVSFDRAGKFAAGVYQLSPPGNTKPHTPQPKEKEQPAKRRRALIVRTRFVRGVIEPD